MKVERLGQIFLLLALLGFIGCGGDDSSSSSTPTFSGNYTGTVQDTFAGAGTLRASLTQSGSNVTGTFQTTFSNFQGGGSVSGTASGNSLSATITPSDPTTCPYNLNANLSGSTLSGTYAAFNCQDTVTGTFTASK